MEKFEKLLLETKFWLDTLEENNWKVKYKLVSLADFFNQPKEDDVIDTELDEDDFGTKMFEDMVKEWEDAWEKEENELFKKAPKGWTEIE